MTPNEFWAIIDCARQRATPNSEPAMLDALYGELVKLPALKLSAWQDLQYAYMNLAHTPKLFAAAVLINGGSSDDRFGLYSMACNAGARGVRIRAGQPGFSCKVRPSL